MILPLFAHHSWYVACAFDLAFASSWSCPIFNYFFSFRPTDLIAFQLVSGRPCILVFAPPHPLSVWYDVTVRCRLKDLRTTTHCFSSVEPSRCRQWNQTAARPPVVSLLSCREKGKRRRASSCCQTSTTIWDCLKRKRIIVRRRKRRKCHFSKTT